MQSFGGSFKDCYSTHKQIIFPNNFFVLMDPSLQLPKPPAVFY